MARRNWFDKPAQQLRMGATANRNDATGGTDWERRNRNLMRQLEARPGGMVHGEATSSTGLKAGMTPTFIVTPSGDILTKSPKPRLDRPRI